MSVELKSCYHYGQVAQKLLDQYIQKNKAYGNNMSKNYRKYGIVAYALRISDKLGRLETLMSNQNIDVGDESIIDTIGDAITYCLMCAGDIAASFVTLDVESDINQAFTQELLADIIVNPGIVQEVVAPKFMNKEKYESMHSQTKYSAMLDQAYESGQMAQGCYKLAMHLFVEYVKQKIRIDNADKVSMGVV